MKTWAEIVAAAKARRACSSAVEWAEAEEQERTVEELAREHPEWAVWCVTNGVLALADIPSAILTGTHECNAGENKFIGGDAKCTVNDGKAWFSDNAVGTVNGGEAWFSDNAVGTVNGGEAWFSDNAVGTVNDGVALFSDTAVGTVNDGEAWFCGTAVGTVKGGEARFYGNAKRQKAGGEK